MRILSEQIRTDFSDFDAYSGNLSRSTHYVSHNKSLTVGMGGGGTDAGGIVDAESVTGTAFAAPPSAAGDGMSEREEEGRGDAA